MKKRLFASVLSLALLISLLPTTVFAAPYDDINGHWAEDAIARWSEYGIVEGTDGLFDPNGQLTRAQLAAIIARLLKLPAAADAGFGDTDGHWAEDVINRCAAAGIMQGDGVNANPDAPVSREETMVMLGRALGIKPVENADLSHYDDDHAVSDWAEGYVAAMTEAGIVNGIGGGLAPADDINRASAMTILDRAIIVYADEPGETVEAVEGGIVLVTAKDVTVTGAADTVLVAPGAAGGTTNLDNATVENVAVHAEDSAVVVGENTSVKAVEVAEKAVGAAVEVTETAEVATVTTEAPKSTVAVSGKVESVDVAEKAEGAAVAVEKTAEVTNVATAAPESTVDVSGKVENVDVAEKAEGAAVAVDKNAEVGTVTTDAPDSTVAVSGKVENVNVNENAAGATVEADKDAKIENVETKAEDTTVTGSGKVENVTTSGDNTTVETEGTKVEAEEGTTGTTAGDKELEGGESTTTKPTTPSRPVEPAEPEEPAHRCRYTAVVTEPTCTEKGYTTYTCRCGDSYVDDYVDALGHDFLNAAWTSDETGHWHICARENCTVTDTKAAHVWLSNNCAEATSCGICAYAKAAGQHTWDEGKVTTEPTCEAKGVKTFTCTTDKCGATKTEDVAATGHSWDEGKVTTEPTCTTKGVKTFTCKNGCGATKTEDVVIDATAHKWGEYKSNNNATCEEDGTKTAECANGCGKTDTVTVAGTKVVHEDGKQCVSCEKFYVETTEGFQTAMEAVKANDTILLASGTYAWPTAEVPENLTIIGEDGAVVDAGQGINTVTATNITVKNVDFTASSGDTTSSYIALQVIGSGTFENCDISGSYGVRKSNALGDVTFRGCAITGEVYAVHFTGGGKDDTKTVCVGDVTLDGCTLSGWTSFGTSGTVTIKDCTFTEHEAYNVLRFYQDATVTGTTVSPKTSIEISEDDANVTVALDSKCKVSDNSNIIARIGTTHPASSKITVDGAIAVSTAEGLKAALADKDVEAIILGAGEYVADLYSDNHAKDSLTIIGTEGTQLAFANLQARAQLYDELTIENCKILRMPNKSWGHLVFSSSYGTNGVYTVKNCTFDGVGTQGIYINETSDAIYNVIDCTFTGDFGSEGAVVIQSNASNSGAFTVNVTGCTFNKIPESSHEICVRYADAVDGWTLNTEDVDVFFMK